MNTHAKYQSVIPPRPLNVMEFAILNRLLSANFAGRDQLHEQVMRARVSEECLDDPSVVFIIDRSPATGAIVNRRIPIEAKGYDQDGIGIHYLLYVVDGFIDELEIFREDSGSVLALPEPASLDAINLDDEP